jgi:ribokinase
MKRDIVVVGSLNMDLVVRAPRLPQTGETILGGDFLTFPGGKGANQAVAASRLDGRVFMVGKVGKDPYGVELIERLKKEQINTDFVFEDAEIPTGVALITVDETGQNTIVVASGANARLTSEEVIQAENVFKVASAVLLQLESPLPAVCQAIDIAHKYGAKVILNPAPAQKLNRKLYSLIDYLIPNETELELLTDLPEGSALIHKVKKLQKDGAKNIVVTLGSQGALVFDGDIPQNVPAHNVSVVDTTAAGDAFVGAFAVALTKGLTIKEMAAWGNAAGALATTHPGAQPSLPRLNELEMLLSSSGYCKDKIL